MSIYSPSSISMQYPYITNKFF